MNELQAADRRPDRYLRVPRHVAIIMDGNGRWAAARGLPRAEGHRRGVEALRNTVRAAGDLGIGVLTIFSFSSENWSRPASEIRDLMGLLRRFIRNDLAELHQNDVRVRVIGERDDLDPDIRRLLEEAEDLTRANAGLVLVVAFNYGARQEIARAARRVAAEVAAGRIKPDAITPELLAAAPRRAGPARPRRHHPHQRRAAAVELPAVAGRLQRTCVRPDLLAGFRSRRARRRHRRISPARAPLRRPRRADRVVICPTTTMPCAQTPPAPLTGAGPSNLTLRVASAAVLAPVAVATAYWGGWPFIAFWALAAIGIFWEWIELVLKPRGQRGALAARDSRKPDG